MNPQTLERLLIDAHLGELPPDVSELLDAFLDCHPILVGERDRIRETMDLASRAIRPPLDDAFVLPPLSKQLTAPPTAGHRRFGNWGRYAALAAVIALAFLLGERFNVPSSLPSPPLRASDGVALVSSGRGSVRSPVNSFWTLSPRESGISRPGLDAQHIDWPAPFVPLWKGERS
jgi:hypothetical protein